MRKNNINKSEIIIYQTPQKEIEVKVHFEGETVWLRQDEISKLYGKERSVITRHINKIFADKEVDKKSNVQFLHIPKSDKPVAFYNLDVILAVGYRTNSSRAIHFRKWATNVLRTYLLKGYALNQRRLLETREKFKELQNAIAFLESEAGKKRLQGQEKEILSLLAGYAKTLSLLEQYDKGKLKKPKGKRAEVVLQYEDCQEIIKEIRKELITKKEASSLFGNETGRGFESIVKNLYQTFSGRELYKTIEEKAAHLLYLTIKDHPFTDGNKRIGSFLFVYFLDKNDYLYRENGEKKINDNALIALALLIAESNPKEKDILIKIITNLISI
ncbi:MAG: virulence protein RhuM/Fic/DOC family protein [Candidatus Marinimicrobia bacterium]|nr:virulence protein RhuM/Fic/DOC family protein [Candidatus Neomarinimicrobiota bacterium]